MVERSKSLKKNIKRNVKDMKLILGVTDKSRTFYVTTENNYKEEAVKHIKEDTKIDERKLKSIEEDLNAESEHWQKMMNLGMKHKQKKRMKSAGKSCGKKTRVDYVVKRSQEVKA